MNIEQIILSVLLALGMLSPIIKVSRFFMEANELLAGVRRIGPIYLAHSAKLKHDPIDKERTLMQFENVTFSYQSQQVINGINLKLVPNSLNVIVGASGHGKSTVAMLACGLLPPSSGTVQVYGHYVSLLTDSARTQFMSVVTQESYLFEGTLRDNILFGRCGISSKSLDDAIAAAQLKLWLTQLPDGLETQLQARGQNLSGGEKQRIAIARALVSNTPLVILDEATAAMDNVTQANFYHALQRHYPKTTFLVITHKYSGLENTSQIFVLNEGRIASQGSHDTLLASCEYYRHSWQLQQSEADQQSTLKDSLDL